MPTGRQGAPAPGVWAAWCPSFPHCELSWRGFAGAPGSACGGLGVESLGVCAVGILFLSPRCLS